MISIKLWNSNYKLTCRYLFPGNRHQEEYFHELEYQCEISACLFCASRKVLK